MDAVELTYDFKHLAHKTSSDNEQMRTRALQDETRFDQA